MIDLLTNSIAELSLETFVCILLLKSIDA